VIRRAALVLSVTLIIGLALNVVVPFTVTVSAEASPSVTLPVAPSVVNAPVDAVVAPTVPLMLIEAVPVRLVTVPDAGVPKTGVTKVGLVANTKAPVPVSSVTAVARFALEGVARKVATPVPRPLTPVEIGRPVALVSVAEEGVPKAGVTKVGEVARTLLPVPVLVTLTAFLLASKAKAVEAVRPDKVVVPEAASDVNAPVEADAAPTVAPSIVPPLMSTKSNI